MKQDKKTKVNLRKIREIGLTISTNLIEYYGELKSLKRW